MGSERTINLHGEEMSYDEFTSDPTATLRKAQERKHAREYPNQGELKTGSHVEACVDFSGAGTGVRVCASENGSYSVGGSYHGVQGSAYVNPSSGNVGACVGVGGSLIGAGPVSLHGSQSVCVEKDRGAVQKTSVGVGPGQHTTEAWRDR